HAFGCYDNAIGNRMGRGNRLQHDFAGARIKTSNEICLLGCKPQNSLLVENGSMRIGLGIGHWILGYIAGPGIQFPNVVLEDGSEPDVSIAVCDQSMRA